MASNMTNNLTEPQYQRRPILKLWKEILLRHDPEFVWLRFMPLNGSYLVIMVPIARFSRMLESGTRASLSSAITYVTRNDDMAEGASASGVFYIDPDLFSTYIYPGEGSKRVEVMTSFVDRNGGAASTCARSRLASLTERLQTEYGLAILLGFEIEVVFMKSFGAANSQASMFEKVGSNHTFCNLTSETVSILPVIEAIVRKLSFVDAAVEKFHAESAPGQWEFVLPPRKPIEAVDMLMRARETISTIAHENGLRATLHPRPYPEHAGTGAHTHISATPLDSKNLNGVESFFAGIMMHFASILAFAMPLDISYARVATGIWSGGEYVCWGWENREAALRRITDTRFEFKLVCGTANPYLTHCAILAAGLDGLNRNLPLTGGDCQGQAAHLSTEQRRSLQITTKLPTSIDESLDMLQSDVRLVRILGESMVSAHVSITKNWNEHLRTMGEEERRNWIICNY